MTSHAIDAAACALAEARTLRTPFPGLPAALRPADEATAYAVQDALHGRLPAAGFGTLAGYKIGCTTAVMQAYLGIDHPCAGGVFAAGVHEGEAAFAAGDFVHPGVECEIAVELGAALDPREAPFDRDAVARAVAALRPAIEVVDDRYVDWRAVDFPTLVADDFFHGACVLGPRVADWRGLDLPALHGATRVNGAAAGSGRGADVLGHPLDALVWLADALAMRGKGLAAGHVVLLGSLTETRWLDPGATAEIEISGLGRVTFRYGA